MSKLMLAFVISMSGVLYDPARVLHFVGPDALQLVYTMKTTLGLR